MRTGTGSTKRRATRIAGIFQAAAPAPDALLTAEARALLDEVLDTVASSVEIVGGAMPSRLTGKS